MQMTRRYDLPRAGRELKALLQDPDDLPRVFSLIEALQGTAAERLRAGFQATETGRELLARQPDIVPLLTDRKALRAMPEGSLAHAYLAFVEGEGISAEGLLEAAAKGERESAPDPFRWQRGRMRDTHDLWHALTGYQGDVLGELALLAFLLGQHWHPGIALVVAGGFSKGLAGDGAWLVAEGFVRGKRAAWLPSQPWEALLPLPVAGVRERLHVGPPPQYQPVRTSELRARRRLNSLSVSVDHSITVFGLSPRSSRAESRDSWSIRHKALSAQPLRDELMRCLSTPLEANGLDRYFGQPCERSRGAAGTGEPP